MEKYRLFTIVDGIEDDMIYQAFQTPEQVQEYLQAPMNTIEELKDYATQKGYSLEVR